MNHHDIAEWLSNSSPDDEIFLHLGETSRRGSPDIEIAFQELANRDADFAHTYEFLKRAADARLVKLRYAARCLFVKRLAPSLGDQRNDAN